MNSNSKKEEVFISSLNKSITFYIGKNAQGNWNIIDEANSDDIWFHIADSPSCHVIANVHLDLNKKEKKYVIKQGALLCKQNSKYKSEKNLKVSYTKIKNVKKTEQVGSVQVSDVSTIII
jgi:predicted ribosome quality control (RQC) complex YloA/Tae2 family protein